MSTQTKNSVRSVFPIDLANGVRLECHEASDEHMTVRLIQRDGSGAVLNIQESQLYISPVFRNDPSLLLLTAQQNALRWGKDAFLVDLLTYFEPYRPVKCAPDTASVRNAIRDEAHADEEWGFDGRLERMTAWPPEARAVYFVDAFDGDVGRKYAIEPFITDKAFEADTLYEYVAGALDGLERIGANKSANLYREALSLASANDDFVEAMSDISDGWLEEERRTTTRTWKELNEEAWDLLAGEILPLLDVYVAEHRKVLCAEHS